MISLVTKYSTNVAKAEEKVGEAENKQIRCR